MNSNSDKSKGWLPPDQAERDKILTVLNSNLLVEAAAGTGKTTSMVGRIIALLRTGACKDIRTLVAVTFTRKAAAELRSRFQIKLEKAIPDATGKEKENLGRALENIEQCYIGTIHSFCARLLRERPIEAGVDIAFQEIDDEADKLLRKEAWDRFISALLANDPNNLLDDLDEYDIELSNLNETFMEFGEYPDIDEWPGSHDRLELHDLDNVVRQVKDYIAYMSALAPILPYNHATDTLIAAYKSIPRIESHYSDLSNPKHLMEVLGYFDSGVAARQYVWKEMPGFSKENAKLEQEKWNTFRENVAQPALKRWRECRYRPVMQILFAAQKMYDDLRHERGVLNFQDLLMKSADMLRDNSAIRKYFKKRFTHLLIDEFQDTDPVQAEVMMYLTATDESETSWRKCIPAPGSLFVVGDPKQSIYRFRRADIVTYKAVKQIIEKSGGEVIKLSTNFRTLEPIINWVNKVFEPDESETIISSKPLLRFPKVECPESPAYVNLQTGRFDKNGRNLKGVFRLDIPDEYTTIDDAVEYEADRIARTIRYDLDSDGTDNVKYDDYLIIARNTKHLSTYARKLQEYGIPHFVTGGRSLNDVNELRLLYTCLLAATNPDNPVYLVAVLRSELCGISDASLYNYKKAGGEFNYHAPVPDGLSAEDSDAFTDSFEKLKKYSHWILSRPPISAIEKIVSDLGLMISASIKPGGEFEAGGLAKCIEILRNDRADSWTCARFIERLGKMIDVEEKYDGISVRSEEIPAVRIMNLHKAKGLEAPVVFLADPSGEPINRKPTLHINRLEDKAKGYVLIKENPDQEHSPKIAHPENWEALSEKEGGFRQSENLRLRYVAATRAELAVIVSQKIKKNNTNPWKYFAEFLTDDMEIPDPGAQSAPSYEEKKLLPEEVEFVEKDINERISLVAAPSYQIYAAKDYALSAESGEEGLGVSLGKDLGSNIDNITIPDNEHGMEWGTVIHTLLQYAMDNPGTDLIRIAENIFREKELGLELVPNALSLVKSITESEIWQRALQSKQCFTEFPFQVRMDKDTGESIPIIVRGAIDLVFEDTDGWVIVDYKTDVVEGKNIKAVVDKYFPQLRIYADVWRNHVGEPVSEAGLYLSHINRYVKINL